ncbi:MAG: response regulator, partial [Planctomycetota bacterium]
MAVGRVLIVHELQSTRGLMKELLARAGFPAEAVDSSFSCISRFVQEPAEVVVLGLSGLKESELELIKTLKRENEPPRVLVCFPSALRDLAVRALHAGADAYLPEPFYSAELIHLVRAHLPPRGPVAPPALPHRVAQEVAHAIHNPLQVIQLLLEQGKTTKKALSQAVPPQLARIRAVVGHLMAYGKVEPVRPRMLDPRPAVERAAAETAAGGVKFVVTAGSVPAASIDERNFAAALRALFECVAARAPEGGEFPVRLAAEGGDVTVTVEIPKALFRNEKPSDLLDQIFVATEQHDVLPGLALARALLATHGASLGA